MSILKSLFRSKTYVSETTSVENIATIYFDMEKKTFAKIKLSPDLTVEDILSLKNIRQKLYVFFEMDTKNDQKVEPTSSSLYITDKNIKFHFTYHVLLCDRTNPFTQITLTNIQKPYNYLKSNPHIFIVILPVNENKIKKKEQYQAVISNPEKHNPTKELENEINYINDLFLTRNVIKYSEYQIIGNLLKYSYRNKKFKKKKFFLNEYELQNLSSSKKNTLLIEKITSISCTLTEPLKYYLSAFENKELLLEIKSSNTKNYLFKFKSQNDYDYWKNNIDQFIDRRDEKLRNINYNKEIINYLNKSYTNYCEGLEENMNLFMILNLDFVRNSLFYTSQNQYNDIFNSITKYKYSFNKGDMVNCLMWFKEITGRLRVEYFDSEGDNFKEMILLVLSKEKIKEYQTLKEEVENIFLDSMNSIYSNSNDILNSKLSEVFSYNLFDELFLNIINKILKPLYEKEFKNIFDENCNYENLDVKKIDSFNDSNFEKLIKEILGNQTTDDLSKYEVKDNELFLIDDKNKDEDKGRFGNSEIIKRFQMILCYIFAKLNHFNDEKFLYIYKIQK